MTFVRGLSGWSRDTTDWPKLGGGTAKVGQSITIGSPWGDKVTGVLSVYVVGPAQTTVLAAIPYENPTGNYSETDPFVGKGYLLSLWGSVIDPASGQSIGNDGKPEGGPYVPPAPDIVVPLPGGGVASAASQIPTGGVTKIDQTPITPETPPEVYKAAQSAFQATTSAPPTPAQPADKTPSPTAPPVDTSTEPPAASAPAPSAPPSGAGTAIIDILPAAPGAPLLPVQAPTPTSSFLDASGNAGASSSSMPPLSSSAPAPTEPAPAKGSSWLWWLLGAAGVGYALTRRRH